MSSGRRSSSGLILALGLFAAVLMACGFLFAVDLLPPAVALSIAGIVTVLSVATLVLFVFIVRDDTGFSFFDHLRMDFASTALWEAVTGLPRPSGTAAVGGAVVVLFAVLAVLLIGSLLNSGSKNPADSAQAPPPKSELNTNPEPPAALLSPVPFTDPVTLDVVRSPNFAWPAAGRLARTYGTEDAGGIDILLDPRGEVTVWASARGTVLFAGGDSGFGYGNYVLVDHDGGVNTLYANLASIAVSSGQRVSKGTVLGTGGSTGDAKTKQLHFEIRESGTSVAPLRYLPSTQFGLETVKPEVVSCPAAFIPLDPNSSATLSFVSDNLSYFSVESVTAKPVDAGSSYPDLVARPRGPLSIGIDIPAYSWGPVVYRLEVILARSTNRISVTCMLAIDSASAVPTYDPASQNGGPISPGPSSDSCKVAVPTAVDIRACAVSKWPVIQLVAAPTPTPTPPPPPPPPGATPTPPPAAAGAPVLLPSATPTKTPIAWPTPSGRKGSPTSTPRPPVRR